MHIRMRLLGVAVSIACGVSTLFVPAYTSARQEGEVRLPPHLVKTVRMCPLAFYRGEEDPWCVEDAPRRMHRDAVKEYVNARIRPQPTTYVKYLAEVCELMADKGYTQPVSIAERIKYCTFYVDPVPEQQLAQGPSP